MRCASGWSLFKLEGQILAVITNGVDEGVRSERRIVEGEHKIGQSVRGGHF